MRISDRVHGGEGKDGLLITGAANADAVSGADVVLLAVPFEGLRPTAEALRVGLAGRLVVSIVAPVEFVDGQMRAVSVPEGSAGELTRDLLPESRVAAAFQNMSARDLLRAGHPLEGDVAVTADDESARRETMALAEAMPSLRAVDAGPLSNSRYVEELTALLVNLNRIHKAHSTIRFLGL
ncbi:MAG: NADPH-dependent F420 reductase [Chloroflexi bacterium]|nr:NADPH-dependent F420 reductase [Chloroflexota bacterium]